MYLNLLLLCGILSQGIIGNLAHENTKEPSDILIRQKRVINRIPGEDPRVDISAAPFIVRIKEDMRFRCLGSILSLHVVITVPICIFFQASRYHVSAGSSHSDHGSLQIVIDVRKHFNNHAQRPEDGIALLTVASPFVYGRNISFIQLHSRPLAPGTLGTVYGWGVDRRTEDGGTRYPKSLRSIEVPILSRRDCVNRYRPHNIDISEFDICTFHPQKYCGHYTESAAPLVVDGYLAGVHTWTVINAGRQDCRYPDVFADLQYSAYNVWITSNVHNIESHF